MVNVQKTNRYPVSTEPHSAIKSHIVCTVPDSNSSNRSSHEQSLISLKITFAKFSDNADIKWCYLHILVRSTLQMPKNSKTAAYTAAVSTKRIADSSGPKTTQKITWQLLAYLSFLAVFVPRTLLSVPPMLRPRRVRALRSSMQPSPWLAPVGNT